MNSKTTFKRLFKFLNSVIILALLTLSFAYVWFNYYNIAANTERAIKEGQTVIFKFTGNMLIIFAFFAVLVVFSRIFGSLKIGYLKMSNVIYSQFLTLICVNAIIYIQLSLVSQKLVNVVPLLLSVVFDIIIVTLWAFVAQTIYSKLYPPRNLVIIYGSQLATELVYKMSSRYDKYKICYSININRGMEAIKETIPSFEGVIICDVPAKIRNDILKYCYEKSIRTYVTPKLSDIIIRGAENIDLFDSPILLCRNSGLDPGQRFTKRIFDIILSSLAILISSPFMLIIALAIKLYDRGPIFYKQERCTLNCKIFNILKFRSMIVDAEKDGVSIPATEHDPRITPVGRVIRTLRLDELPQLFNILLGDMSIVGPRPERIEHIQKYSEEIPEFRFRMKVKGGLTGYAQVFGKYNTTAYDKLKLDLMYIQNYSFILDVKLVLSTLKILFMKESTEGFKPTEINIPSEDIKIDDNK